MKKIVFICLLLLSLLMGFSNSATAEKVYPKANTEKGLAPYLYLPDNPTPAVIKINEAKQAWFEERYQEACDLWREALNLSPNHPEGIWHDIGMCSMALGAYNDAVEAYTNMMKLSSKETAEDYRKRGEAYLKAGDEYNAQKDFSKADSMARPKNVLDSNKRINNVQKKITKTIPTKKQGASSYQQPIPSKVSQIYSKITDYFRNWNNVKTLKTIILMIFLTLLFVALYQLK